MAAPPGIPSTSDALTAEERERYARHLVLPDVGLAGQAKLKRSSVLIVGAGGLGSPVALYLAAAGVGRLGLVDHDAVDVGNLQRQVLYSVEDVGTSKVEAARRRLAALNPNVRVEVHQKRLTSRNALAILQDYDVVVDASDNFPTRYLVNDACVLARKPLVYGSIYRFEGQASVFWAEKGPCYRCLYPKPPPPDLVPSCADGGVLGALPGIVGSIQASEALKIILGIGESLVGRLVLLDALDVNLFTVRVPKNPACVVCGPEPTVTRLIDYDAFCSVQRGEQPMDANQILPVDVKRKLDRQEDLVLLDVREPYEYDVAHIPESIHIPMREIERRVAELDPTREIVVFCHHQGRSARVAHWLRGRGFPRVRVLMGGIDAWATEVDPTMPQY